MGHTQNVSGAGPTLPPDEIAHLLHRSEKAIQSGNRAGARALLRALTQYCPDEPRVWHYLAQIAETPDERAHALAQVRQPDAAASASALPTSNPAPTHTAPPAARSDASRRWFYLAGGVLLLLALLWAINQLLDARQTAWSEMPLPPLPDEGNAGADFSATPLPGVVARTSHLPAPTATIAATPTPLPAPTVQAHGTLLTYDNWQATLLRPEYTQLLSNTVAGVQAQGQFALTLLAVSNTTDQPRHIPADLFGLVDDRGRLYRPIAGASSAYLATYGRGQHGDLALEDALPAGGGMVSIPLLFDVALDVQGLTLTMGRDARQGWQVMRRADETATPPPIDEQPATTSE